MKKIIFLATFLIAINPLSAQEKEIKKAQQAVSSGNLSSASSYLQQAKRIFAAADSKTRAQYYVVEAEMKIAVKDIDTARLESISKSLKLANKFEVTSSLQDRIALIELKLRDLSASVAAGEFKNKNFSKAASLYSVAYQSTQDTIHYLNAARSYLLAKEYKEAFSAYSRLYNMGFTAAKTRYVATNVKSNTKEAFTSASKRNAAIRQRTHKKPQVVKTNSKIPELLRGITMSSIELNKNYEAVAIIDLALARMPDNEALLNQALHLYRQLDADDKYNSIVDELIKKTPNDPNLYYNFAVSSDQGNDFDRTKKFYKKTLELDPNHLNAISNLSILLLDQEKPIIDEMNSLGMSDAEDKRYEELDGKRNELYYEVLPYIESIVRSQPQNKNWTNKLIKIYSYLGEDTKMSLLQEKIDD